MIQPCEGPTGGQTGISPLQARTPPVKCRASTARGWGLQGLSDRVPEWVTQATRLCLARRGSRRPESEPPAPLPWQRPSPLPSRHVGPFPAGAQGPGQRPPRHRRALRPRRAGRWPLVVRVGPASAEPSHAGGETRCVSFFRPKSRKTLHRSDCGDHRLCHIPALNPRQARNQSPRPRTDAPSSAAPSRTGGGNAVRFLVPPA